jgi:folate-binding protein YgfZ
MTTASDRASTRREPNADAVWCPIDDLGMLQIDGADAGTFLHAQLASDVAALRPGTSQWSCYNSPKGRVLANLRLWHKPSSPVAGRYGALLAADLAEAMRKRLSLFVLRAKVAMTDGTAKHRFFGVSGERAAEAVAAAFGVAPPANATVEIAGTTTLVALPDGRIIVITTDAAAANASRLLAPHATEGDARLWRWLDIQAGVPLITAATSDHFVAQMINWDALSGISFTKGCYPGQEIIARTRYLGRLKERLFAFHGDTEVPAAGTRLYSPAFGDQPCGTVVNAIGAPQGGTDLLAVVQIAASEAAAVALGAPEGPQLALRALPYSIPEATAPRGRSA